MLYCNVQDASQVSPVAPKHRAAPIATAAARPNPVKNTNSPQKQPPRSAETQAQQQLPPSLGTKEEDPSKLFAGNRYVVSGVPEKIRWEMFVVLLLLLADFWAFNVNFSELCVSDHISAVGRSVTFEFLCFCEVASVDVIILMRANHIFVYQESAGERYH